MSVATPIVVDLGKARRKHAKELRKGQGKLASEVAAALKEVHTSLGAAAQGKRLVPVVVIYRKKPAKGFKFPGM